MIFPPPLPRGSHLGVLCPASPTDPERLERGCRWLEELGYVVRRAPSTDVRSGLHAGTREVRAREVQAFFDDPTIDGILCVRGGSGTMGILPYLEYERIRSQPKLVIGMSDITALSLALLARAGLASIAGQMVVQLHGGAEPFTVASWHRKMGDPWGDTLLANPEWQPLEVLREGNAEGPLIAANLAVFSSMIGTPYMPDLRGAILMLEDIDERPEGLDRAINQIRLSGLDRGLAGLVLGQFTHCLPRNQKLTEEDGLRVIWDWAHSLDIPAIRGFAFGHEAVSLSVPFGARARLLTDPPSLLIEGNLPLV